MATVEVPILPLVLAGPVLRRADPYRVYVWLATSESLADPQLEIREVTVRTRGASTLGPNLSTASQTVTLQLGARLWIHLLRASAGSPSSGASTMSGASLPTDTLLAYDVVETGASQRGLRRLLEIDTIVLLDMPLPTFVLQGERSQLHLLYGSCRKLHGPGRDNAPALHRLLEARARFPRSRVQTLLLGGDQVYADDVADLLIQYLSALGAAVLGRTEDLPSVPRPGELPLRGRARLVKDKARMTSGEAENHLLTVGEWIAAYLLAWNPDLWPRRLPTLVESWGAMDHRERPPVASWATTYADQVRLLHDAQQGSSAMRRVLANVATYMIFDDHEVTDDWNLNAEWIRDVRGTDLGRRLLLNGMAVYWAFQAWGNEPVDFDASFAEGVGRYLATGSDPETAQRLIDGHRDWGFVVPSTPRAVVADTRTRRGPTRGWDVRDGTPVPRNRHAPRLLGSAARRDLRSRLAEAVGHRSAVVLLTPSPVWGLEDLEGLLAPVGYVAPAAVDLESWSANPRSRFDLMMLAQELRIRPLVVLSGDVHYGFSVAARSRRDGQDTLFAQFTSSATKNETGGGLGFALKVLGYELPSSLTTTHVWISPDEDGPTFQSSNPLGNESWVEQRDYATVDTTLAVGDIQLVRNVLVLHNNVGELSFEGDAVVHRHWSAGGRPDPHVVVATRWSPSNWPV